MKEKKRIPMDDEPLVWTSPFAALKDVELPSAQEARRDADGLVVTATIQSAPKKSRGRVDISRQTAHRGGKTVTIVSGFIGIGWVEKERIEIQGDQRDIVARILASAGFRPLHAGG